MKLNLLSIMLVGSPLFLTACGGDEHGDNSSMNSNTDINQIQNPVVITPIPYDIKDNTLPLNVVETVVMTSKMKGVTRKERQAIMLLSSESAPSTEDWPIGLGAWCREDC